MQKHTHAISLPLTSPSHSLPPPHQPPIPLDVFVGGGGGGGGEREGG